MGTINKISTEQETAPHFIAIRGRINEKEEQFSHA